VASKNEIEQFLKEFKRCSQIHVVDERQDGKNDETLAILGILPKQRLEEIKSLSYKNYFRGPTPDHGNPSEYVWEFGKRVIRICLGIWQEGKRKRDLYKAKNICNNWWQ